MKMEDHAPPLDVEELNLIIMALGDMVDARFEALQDRLLPEKVVRPPLVADSRRAKEMPIKIMNVTEANPVGTVNSTTTTAVSVALSQRQNIVQPLKKLEIRITELDGSTTKERVERAIAQIGGYPLEPVKAVRVAFGLGGMRATLVWCPVPVANALTDAGQLRVRVGMAKVEVMEKWPIRCWKCLSIGHVEVRCLREGLDRSGWCFRCRNP